MSKRRSLWILLGLIVIVVAAIWGVEWWRFHRTHVSTDNAYVRADNVLITPRIPGTISELAVEDHWQVTAGTVLARLDRADYELRLRQADAALARAREGVAQARAAVWTAESQARAAEAQLAQARLDEARVTQLASGDAAPADRVEHAHTARRTAEAQVEAARRGVEQARAFLGISLDAPDTEASSVRQATAARDEAALLLSYTELRASSNGVVTKRSVEVGQAVQPGQPIMVLVPLERVYIEANFKETQLAAVRVGQPATIVADLYPDHVYTGRVASLAPGSGAAFALLPPENASGNWVKVVQRVPVRITLDAPPPPEWPLRVSVSVVATIDVTSSEGSRVLPLTQPAHAAP